MPPIPPLRQAPTRGARRTPSPRRPPGARRAGERARAVRLAGPAASGGRGVPRRLPLRLARQAARQPVSRSRQPAAGLDGELVAVAGAAGVEDVHVHGYGRHQGDGEVRAVAGLDRPAAGRRGGRGGGEDAVAGGKERGRGARRKARAPAAGRAPAAPTPSAPGAAGCGAPFAPGAAGGSAHRAPSARRVAPRTILRAAPRASATLPSASAPGRSARRAIARAAAAKHRFTILAGSTPSAAALARLTPDMAVKAPSAGERPRRLLHERQLRRRGRSWRGPCRRRSSRGP